MNTKPQYGAQYDWMHFTFITKQIILILDDKVLFVYFRCCL